MPSTYAHYRMGQEVIEQVSGSARDIIMKHKQLYGMDCTIILENISLKRRLRS